jgi:hypothetical protein
MRTKSVFALVREAFLVDIPTTPGYESLLTLAAVTPQAWVIQENLAVCLVAVHVRPSFGVELATCLFSQAIALRHRDVCV